MGRTRTFYSDEETEQILRDEYLLAMHKGVETKLVTSALKEYRKNHRKEAVAPPMVNAPIPTVRIRI